MIGDKDEAVAALAAYKQELSGDWAKAHYLVDPQTLSKVRVYVADATRSDQSGVAGINGSGTDVTD